MSDAQELHVLLVEDDDEDAFIFMRHMDQLANYHAHIEHAKEAEEAWARLREDDYALIFLDLNLGGASSGMDLLRRLSEDGVDVPVIVVTGSGNELKAVEAMKSGAYDYLVKDSLNCDLLDRTIRHALERHALERERAAMVRKLAELSITDELSGLANRRYLIQRLEEEVARSERTGHLFAALMVDLDHFKLVNDRHGHQVGDEVLKQVAQALRATVRGSDFVGRYGGEEFCVVLPDTYGHGAHDVAEKLREAVGALPEPVPTISVGVAFWKPDDSAGDLLRHADLAMYEAKRRGRDQTVLYAELDRDRSTPA